MIHFQNRPATSGNQNYCPPPATAIFHLILRTLPLPLVFLIFLPALSAQHCVCGTGVNLTGATISLNALVSGGTLPSGSYSGPCISVPANATLNIDIPYQFSGTTLVMGPNSRIFVAAPNLLTVTSSTVRGCGSLWQGITLAPETLTPLAIPGGQINMSQSTLQDAEVGIFAQNQSKLRLVSNTFQNNYIGLRVTGFVPFINFGDPNDFSGNTFQADANYIVPGYDAATSPRTGIHFTNATTFFIGQDFTNPATVLNYIKAVRRGVEVDNSRGLGLYGLQIFDLTGALNSAPDVSNRVAIRIDNSRNINVKYCNIYGTTPQTRPWHGIVTFNNSGNKQIYHDNSIVVQGTRGIYVTGITLPNTRVDMQNNYVFSNTACIEVIGFAGGTNNSLFLNKNQLNPRVGRGFFLQNVAAPYRIHDNTIWSAVSTSLGLGSIFQCTGRGDVYSNDFDMRTNSTAEILTLGSSSNCKIYENTLYGNAANPGGLFDSGINTANSSNLIYCCNSVDNTTYGTQFNLANSDVRFYTTQYGEHDTALYFPPAASLNAQNNTGNTWAGATTSLDAYYAGDQAQAQANAPFRTNPANINASKIQPLGWFIFFGNDPTCSETNTITCDTLNLPTGFTEITSEDMAGLTPPGYDNEEALRFEQKRQLYRKLKENPALVNWNTGISNFYNASANNSVGAMYEVDEAWRKLYAVSAGVSDAYESMTGNLDDLSDAVAGIYDDYPGANTTQQAALLADLRDLTTQILEIEEDVNDLTEQERDEYDERLDDLLTLNSAMATAEIWETAEKNINDLFFRFCTGQIQTFTSGQQNQIVTLAKECPQFYGAGVYKARFLREQIDTVSYHYFENHCVGAERSNRPQTAQQVSVVPNPAADRITVNLSKVDGQSGKITLQSLNGRTVLTRDVAAGSQALDISNILPGVYLLTVDAEGSALLTTKLVIIR